MAYQVIKQALVWTKQETQLSYEIENRIIAGYFTLVSTSKIINLVQNILYIRYVYLYVIHNNTDTVNIINQCSTIHCVFRNYQQYT
jgi:hypothetical protein